MPMTIEIRGERFSEVKLSTTDLMQEVGLLARERILTRTAQGEGADGPFAPYSAAYAAAKAKALGAGPVNLQVSGRMLQGLVITAVSENSVTLGFSN